MLQGNNYLITYTCGSIGKGRRIRTISEEWVQLTLHTSSVVASLMHSNLSEHAHILFKAFGCKPHDMHIRITSKR